MSRTKRQRAFVRNDTLSIRMPEADKNDLKQLARIKRRDTSNLALEAICRYIAAERGLIQETHPGQ